MHDVINPVRSSRILASDSRFEVKLASNQLEIESALRLRFRVFSEELGSTAANSVGIESDFHDNNSEHLIMVDRISQETVGTYRIKSFQQAGSASGFYSYEEFTLESLPTEVLVDGFETGRACIAREHRHTRAIFLIWKALARHLSETGRRYFFGCCSIFTKDPTDGARAFKQLQDQNLVHDRLRVQPRRPILASKPVNADTFKLPGLFEMYLRIGSRVCGPPIYDEAFGTVDFFVVFDLQEMAAKYREMFLGSLASNENSLV